VKELIN